MNRRHLTTSAVLALSVFLFAGCAAGGAIDDDLDDAGTPGAETSSSPEATDDAPDDQFMQSLADLAGTEWSGLDDEYNDRVTFIFATDGTVSYRNTGGTFADPADTWTVVDDLLTFQVTYGGPFGVGDHTGTYDAMSGVLTVEYVTTTNRASFYSLTQVG